MRLPHDAEALGRLRVPSVRDPLRLRGQLVLPRGALDGAHRAELALLTDMSAAYGSQVISMGCRLVEKRRFTASVGVATALLLRNGISVVSQRDPKTLGKIHALLEPSFVQDPAARDYHQTEWYVTTFGPH